MKSNPLTQSFVLVVFDYRINRKHRPNNFNLVQLSSIANVMQVSDLFLIRAVSKLFQKTSEWSQSHTKVGPGIEIGKSLTCFSQNCLEIFTQN